MSVTPPSPRQNRRLTTAFFLLFVALRADASPAEYQVSGRITETSHNYEFASSFQLSYSNCLWDIKQDSFTTNNLLTARQDSYDGTQVYSFGPMDKKKFAVPPKHDSMGTLLYSASPDQYSVSAVVLWMGLASQCTFTNETSGSIPPLWWIGDRRLRPEIYTAPFRAEFLGAPPGLVRTLSFFTDGMQYKRDRLTGEKIVERLPSPYSAGHLDRELSVGSTTNVGGLQIPQQFVYRVYRPKDQGTSTNDLRVVQTFTVVVTNVIDSCEGVSFVPNIENRIVETVDRRFATVAAPDDRFIYDNTNGAWLSPDHETVVIARNTHLARTGVDTIVDEDKIRKRTFIRILFILVFGGFLAVLVLSRKRPT
ncbi:MAG: hypothetical protein ACI8QF_004374 [Limisphaerales bacterium]|jgi:hypothetical protein